MEPSTPFDTVVEDNQLALTPLQFFLNYPFATDETYQQGLTSIVNRGGMEGVGEEEREEIVRRSKVFYFNRITGHSITVDEIRQYDISNDGERSIAAQLPSDATPDPDPSTIPGDRAPTPTQTNGVKYHNNVDEPRTLSFSELKTLIEQGRTDEIPNNKKISDVISSETPSESRALQRRKPWEVNGAGAQVSSP